MCGRFTILTVEELRDVMDAVEGRAAARALHTETSRRQAFPGSAVPVIGLDESGLSIEELRWGFPSGRNKGVIFNTRIESALAGAPMWRNALQNGRCIVPAASFYEPHATEKATSLRTGKLVKRPYEFQSNDDLPLLMAGMAAEGNCSVVTCEPNRWVSPVHARMPLILRFEEVPCWLEGDVRDLAQLADRSGIALDRHAELELAQTTAPESGSDQLALF